MSLMSSVRMISSIYKNAVNDSQAKPLVNKHFLALPALLNNPLLPKKKIHPHTEAIIMHMNIIKCIDTFSQYTWADRPIIADGTLQPTFSCRRLKTESMKIMHLYDETINSIIKKQLRSIREKEIEINLRESMIHPFRNEFNPPIHYETMMNIFKETPAESAIVKTTCGHIYGSVRTSSGIQAPLI